MWRFTDIAHGIGDGPTAPGSWGSAWFGGYGLDRGRPNLREVAWFGCIGERPDTIVVSDFEPRMKPRLGFALASDVTNDQAGLYSGRLEQRGRDSVLHIAISRADGYRAIEKTFTARACFEMCGSSGRVGRVADPLADRSECDLDFGPGGRGLAHALSGGL